jgi:predicted  nucleic acid-binding Zn-ribbon protein
MQRDQQRLDGGAITSAKELESLQHEVISLQRRTSDLEDAELEVMERLDEIQQRLGQLVADRERVLAERDSTTIRRDEATAAIDAELAELDEHRAEVASAVPADLLALYEKLRASNAGIGAALIQHRRCQGCRLELNATDIGRLRDAADDEVLRCDECGRILIRTADSGL